MIPVVLVLTPGDRRGAILAGQPLRLPGPGPAYGRLAYSLACWPSGSVGGDGEGMGEQGLVREMMAGARITLEREEGGEAVLACLFIHDH